MGQPLVTPADNHKHARKAALMLSPTPTAFIGCDVGKSEIVLYHGRTGHRRTVPNRLDALERVLAELEDTCLIVCESTGGYEATLLQAAVLAGRAAHRADARKVKAFIRSYGTLGKTDRLDAQALARYGAERDASLARWQAPDADRDRLQALVLTRCDLGRPTPIAGTLLALHLWRSGCKP
jgi:transposase